MCRPQKQELFILSKSFIQSSNENSKEPDGGQVVCISSQWDIVRGNCETKKQAGVEMRTETEYESTNVSVLSPFSSLCS